jgi:phage shock protein PspC (stress-responsive transcriptional regulator)
MNRKTAIELGGRVFQIEEAAITEIEAYLAALRRSFSKEADAAEIIADIESRMSELFAHKTGMNRPISLEDARAVLAVMGAPADIGAETTSPAHEPVPGTKRLFRHPEDQVVAGVCSGLGAYFGIDPVWIRLAFAFALFSFGTGLLLYVLLILIVPEASTPAERLMMHGEAVTLENMEHRLKSEGRKVQENLRRRFSNPLSRGVYSLLRAFTKFVGYFTWIVAFTATAGLSILLFLLWWKPATIRIGGVQFNGIASGAALFRNTTEAQLCAGLLASLLLLSVITILLQLFRKPGTFKVIRKIQLLLTSVCSLITLGLIILAFLNATAYKEHAEYGQQHLYPPSDTLLIFCNQANQSDDGDFVLGASADRNAGIQLSHTRLEMIRHSDTNIRLEVFSVSMGPSKDSAYQLAATLPEAYTYHNGTLRINNKLQLKPGTPFRGQHRRIRLSIPRNTVLVSDRNTVSLQMQEHDSHWE